MIDLHSHILPGVDDGAPSLDISLAMARAYVEQGVSCVACTPHILPGVYENTGAQIKQATAALQDKLEREQIPLKLVPGADNHIVPDFVQGLERGHLLALAGSAYVLVEPPHHVAPPKLGDILFNILLGGYIPILTHPERLSWIEREYSMIQDAAARGVWMQITAGSLLGRFGRRPRYWAERMLGEGLVHILATDAHNMTGRPPDLLEGRAAAERIAGGTEAQHLVVTRPEAAILNKSAKEIPAPPCGQEQELHADGPLQTPRTGLGRNIGQRVRRLFD
jgi:protein-tyrosine phosphatase